MLSEEPFRLGILWVETQTSSYRLDCLCQTHMCDKACPLELALTEQHGIRHHGLSNLAAKIGLCYPALWFWSGLKMAGSIGKMSPAMTLENATFAAGEEVKNPVSYDL